MKSSPHVVRLAALACASPAAFLLHRQLGIHFAAELASSRFAQVSSPAWWISAVVVITILGLLLKLGALKSREREYAEFVRRAAEREAMHEQRYRELLDNASDIVYTHDLEGKLITWSKAGELITGYEQQELVQRNLVELVLPERREAVRAWIRQIVEGQAPATFELVITAKNGHPVILDVSTRIITRGGGRAGILGFARDITARKHSEEEAQRARAAAEAASRLKSEFLANMSHEIRTPMNGILGMTELALESDLSPEQREFLAVVKMSADSLLDIINDILDFSKIEAGKLELDSAPFSLRYLLETTLKPFMIRARQKGLHLACDFDPRVPDGLMGDSTRLRQVLTNLAENAIKFTEKGSIRVSVQAVALNQDQVVLRFDVTDTGIGIPPEKQQIVFEAFTQADGSTTRKFGGTGLGLTITKKLVSMMGGEINVQSEAGQGSAFSFTLPFPLTQNSFREASGQSVLASEAIAPPALESFAVPREAGPSPRILLAEDNAANRKLILHLLQKQGYTLEAAKDGREALAILEKAGPSGFDAVLMDIQMPHMNGFEVTRIIRHNEDGSHTHLPIIALTAHAMKGDMERCLQAGMDGYIAKPIDREELYATVGRFTARGAEHSLSNRPVLAGVAKGNRAEPEEPSVPRSSRPQWTQ
ncbi:MAG: ATP-binding protein [Terriglobia bacterium]